MPLLQDDSPAATIALRRHLSAVYSVTQSSKHLFASPVGPFEVDGRPTYVPRFVFLGPYASDVAWRIAFLAGFNPGDLRGSHALLALAEHLAEEAEHGHGLNVSFFPWVDAASPSPGTPVREFGPWPGLDAPAPEILLLEKDPQFRNYHGFVRLETAEPGEEVASVRICGALAGLLAPDLALITSDDIAAFPVRFESGLAHGFAESGWLSWPNDSASAPFELTLRIPRAWLNETYQSVVVPLLLRFLWRYRAFQAYGLNL